MKNKYVVSLIIDLVVIVMNFVLFKKDKWKSLEESNCLVLQALQDLMTF